ncbi:ATP-binding protein [Tenacibaculum finnmarkense]|uniref:ATP-binding protein n=1 Tax=Tenacibaculum finnmarkense TaxID=2781243 RepID=UPI000C4E1074|nr:ATP-binding protein [Tenacibaculum finnmarkense]MCD8423563.1 AAA family ATPase [Tenacibaculum finnmarkense genomovar ulcerans]MCG8239707.1 AAA family ATPase [Tenacibaculum finnmarkense genomovar ulcerans]SOS48559.1 conserved hypothetical protein [Tenacibaculum dicentrarchi]
MKIGDITQDEKYSYKEVNGDYLSDINYILAVKDEDSPDRNIIPLLQYKNGKIIDIDTYDIDKIVATPNNNMSLPPISERFSLNELVKISYGTIIENARWYEGGSLPKCITFHTNIHAFDKNEVIEIFKGEIDEAKSRFKPTEITFNSLLLDVYVDTSKILFFEYSDNKILGPFKVLSKDSEGYFEIEKSQYLKFGLYELKEDSFIEFNVNQLNRKIIIPSFKTINFKNTIDFISDIDLIKKFKNDVLEKPNDFKIEEINKIFNDLKKVIGLESIENILNNNTRLEKILKNSEEVLISKKHLASILPDISKIKTEIEEIKEEKFKVEKELRTKIIEKDNILTDIEEKKYQKIHLEEELKTQREAKEEQLSKENIKLEEDIGKLKSKKVTLEKDIEDETKKRSDELSEIKVRKKILDEDVRDLQHTVNQLKDENKKAQNNSLEQLMELFKHKKHFDFLSGRDISSFEEKTKKTYSDFTVKENLFEDYETFRNQLSEILKNNGRHLEKHFIDNLLISVHQNTLTILAGLPGTGKTTLSRMLSQILAPKERVKEISINRGWSSQKDLIGFSNPLNNKFHSSPTGMYDLLKQLNYESENETYLDCPMSYIILDEANLSPIEHYWSAFYNLTDSLANKDSLLKIELSQSEIIEYANNIRFIATINHDQTTESLSPRVIDRSNIIQIKPNSLSINEISNNKIECLNLSYHNIKKFFQLLDFNETTRVFDFNEEIRDIYKKVNEIFKNDLKIFISPRVETNIKRYCNVAQNLMREKSKPIDYCISQRLLPMINVYGDKFKQPLEKLLIEFQNNDLTISAEILNKIISYGNDNEIYEGHFNYFLTLSNV